jgi:putative transcriptional regulator
MIYLALEEKGQLQNRIAVLRAERKLSQKEVADGVGVSRQTIISLEKNRYNPSLKLAFELAIFFGVDLHDVFEYVREEKE